MRQFFKTLFTRKNLSKIRLIFVTGLLCRSLVFLLFNVNVFTDFYHPVSLTYYLLMAVFAVFANELFAFFDFSLIPDFTTLWTIIPSFTKIWSSLPRINFKYLSLNYIRESVSESSKDLLNQNKLFLNSDETKDPEILDKKLKNKTYDAASVSGESCSSPDLPESNSKAKGKAKSTYVSKATNATPSDIDRSNAPFPLYNNNNNNNNSNNISLYDKMRRKMHWVFL